MENILYFILWLICRPEHYLFMVIILLIWFWHTLQKYRKSSYYKITGNSFFTCYFGNLGQKGEYLIYDRLKKEENKGHLR